MKKIAALAMSFAVASVLVSSAFADNLQGQGSFGDFSPNTSAFSNNDVGSDNVTGSNNIQPVASFNDLSTNDSYNATLSADGSFNDRSRWSFDSHDDDSVNQAALGQVNLNDSHADAINAADNQSTIFDGGVFIGGGNNDSNVSSLGGWGSSGSNVNTGIVSNAIFGNESALFSGGGIGLNGSDVRDSGLTAGSVVNQNLLNP